MLKSTKNFTKRPFSTSLHSNNKIANFMKKNASRGLHQQISRLSRVVPNLTSDKNKSHRISLQGFCPPSSILDGPFSPTMNMATHLKAEIASDADLMYNNLSAGPFKTSKSGRVDRKSAETGTPFRPKSQFFRENDRPYNTVNVMSEDDEVVVM